MRKSVLIASPSEAMTLKKKIKNLHLKICYVMAYAVQVNAFTKTLVPTLLLSENTCVSNVNCTGL